MGYITPSSHNPISVGFSQQNVPEANQNKSPSLISTSGKIDLSLRVQIPSQTIAPNTPIQTGRIVSSNLEIEHDPDSPSPNALTQNQNLKTRPKVKQVFDFIYPKKYLYLDSVKQVIRKQKEEIEIPLEREEDFTIEEYIGNDQMLALRGVAAEYWRSFGQRLNIQPNDDTYTIAEKEAFYCFQQGINNPQDFSEQEKNLFIVYFIKVFSQQIEAQKRNFF